MKDTKIQWHPGFVAAMNLEFEGNRSDLIYEKEYNLNTKPLEIDLLVIKKDPNIQIVNEIGKIFRGHNIIEYKSPSDAFDVDTFYKAGAYGCLYKAAGETVDERAADDITISLIRDTKPEGLFQYFEQHEVKMENPYPGIYYIMGAVLFPTQIIVGKELKQTSHAWLKALSDKMQKQEMRGDESMCEALLEIMRPEVEIIAKESEKKGKEKGREEGEAKALAKVILQLNQKGFGSKEIADMLDKKEEEIEAVLLGKDLILV